MNYKRIYDSIINNAMRRTIEDDVYYEKHHIIPKCVGGTNKAENKVKLTPREHFLCHWILTKIYIDNNKILFAWNSFCMNTYGGDRPTSHFYEYARLRYSKMMKELVASGEFKPHSPKGSIWMKNGDKCVRIPEESEEAYIKKGWKKGRVIKHRKPHSKETIKKMRKPHTNKCTNYSNRPSPKGKVWVTEKETNKCKMVKKEEIDNYTLNGWKLGRTFVRKQLTDVEKNEYRTKLGKRYSVTFPDGHVEIIKNLRLFCDDHNLVLRSMYKVMCGEWEYYKGFKCEKF